MALVGNRVPGDGEHWVITSLSLSLLLLVLLSVALSRVHSSRANRNATELRALSEGLRVQNVWRQAGIARAVSLHYLRRSHDNIAWVRRAMLAASIYPQSEASTLKTAINAVKESWVRDQKNYFEKTSIKKSASTASQNAWLSGCLSAVSPSRLGCWPPACGGLPMSTWRIRSISGIWWASTWRSF
jgi:hypothetical protein